MAGNPFYKPAAGQAPDFDAPIVAAGGQPFPVGTDSEREHVTARDRCEFVFRDGVRPAPDFDFAMATGSEEIAIGTESQGLHDRAVRHAWSGVEAGLEQLEVG